MVSNYGYSHYFTISIGPSSQISKFYMFVIKTAAELVYVRYTQGFMTEIRPLCTYQSTK